MKPEDILDRPDDKEFLKEFIKGAHQVHTGLFQMYRIASDIHLAQSLRGGQRLRQGDSALFRNSTSANTINIQNDYNFDA